MSRTLQDEHGWFYGEDSKLSSLCGSPLSAEGGEGEGEEEIHEVESGWCSSEHNYNDSDDNGDDSDDTDVSTIEERNLTEEEKAIDDYWTDRNFAAADIHKGIYCPADRDFTDDIMDSDPPHNYDADEDHKTCNNLVWWDVNTFPLSDKKRAGRVVVDIQRWLRRSKGYDGPVELHAYGDMNKMPYLWKELVKAHAECTHVQSQGGAEGAGAVEGPCFYTIYADITISMLAHPPPANYLIISGDKRFEAVGLSLGAQCFGCILARPSPLHHADSDLQVVWKDIAIERV